MEQVVEWFLEDTRLGASPAEVIWLLSNFLGVWLSLLSVSLTLSDRRRVGSGRMSETEGDSRASVLRERNGIIVLGDAAARAEFVRALIHFGNGLIGVMAVLSPEPANQKLTFVAGVVTTWFLVTSVLLLLKTVWALKARYDYRYVRHIGRKASWHEAVRAMTDEIRANREAWARRKVRA